MAGLRRRASLGTKRRLKFETITTDVTFLGVLRLKQMRGVALGKQKDNRRDDWNNAGLGGQRHKR